MTDMDKLRTIIAQHVKKCIDAHRMEIDEISTTAGAGPYNTPNAFTGTKKKNLERKRRIAQALGWKITDKGMIDLKRRADPVEHVVNDELRLVNAISRHAGKSLMESAHAMTSISDLRPHQKIGKAISEINKQLSQLESAMTRQRKFKVREGVDSSALWKRTLKQLVRLEGRLLSIAHEIRELKK